MEFKTVANYARLKGVTPACVYKWIKSKKIESTKIDGVTFIKVKQ